MTEIRISDLNHNYRHHREDDTATSETIKTFRTFRTFRAEAQLFYHQIMRYCFANFAVCCTEFCILFVFLCPVRAFFWRPGGENLPFSTM